MPNLRLYGKPWHVSTDSVPLSALPGLVCHVALVLLEVIYLFIVSGPASCDKAPAGTHFLVASALLLFANALSAVTEVALVAVGLQGTPLEVSKRRSMIPLLYWQNANWLLQLGVCVYGTYVIAGQHEQLPPQSCWRRDGKDVALDVVVAFTWAVNVFNWTRAFFLYSLFPSFDELKSWERRFKLLTLGLGNREVVKRAEDWLRGKQGEVGSIAELYGNIVEGVDLSPTDQVVALVLVHVLQRKHRWQAIAHALIAAGAVNPSTTYALDDKHASAPAADQSHSGSGARRKVEARWSGGGRRVQAVDRQTGAVAEAPVPPEAACCSASRRPGSNGGEVVLDVHEERGEQGHVSSRSTAAAAQRPGSVDQVDRDLADTEAICDGSDADSDAEQCSTSGRQAPPTDGLPTGALRRAADEQSQAALEVLQAAAEQHAEPDQPQQTQKGQTGGHDSSSGGPYGSLQQAQRSATSHSRRWRVRRRRHLAGGAGTEDWFAVGRSGCILTPSGMAADLAPQLDPEEAADIYTCHHQKVEPEAAREAQRFAKYAVAAYGRSAYFMQKHMKSRRGVMHLLFTGRSALLAPRVNPLNRDKLRSLSARLDYEAIIRLTGISDADLLYWNTKNLALGSLPYLIALDRPTTSVVVAIRGTQTWANIATDIMSAPMALSKWLPNNFLQEAGLEEAYAHAGMVAAADAILEDLKRHGILGLLLSQHEEDLEAQAPATDEEAGDKGSKDNARGKYVAAIMKEGLHREGWRLVLTGHSLGAGAATLVSLKLRHLFPELKCLAYCPPGGLVDPALAAAVAPWVTSLAVGKDAIPRMTLVNLGRLVGEMVAALAHCQQPAAKVLLVALSKRLRRKRLRYLLRPTAAVPPEPLQFLNNYIQTSGREGTARDMVPPGRMIYLRRLKRPLAPGRRDQQRAKYWDAVWIKPEALIAEGILVSPRMTKDHYSDTLMTALNEVAARKGVAVRNDPQAGGGTARPSQDGRMAADEQRMERGSLSGRLGCDKELPAADVCGHDRPGEASCGAPCSRRKACGQVADLHQPQRAHGTEQVVGRSASCRQGDDDSSSLRPATPARQAQQPRPAGQGSGARSEASREGPQAGPTDRTGNSRQSAAQDSAHAAAEADRQQAKQGGDPQAVEEGAGHVGTLLGVNESVLALQELTTESGDLVSEH